MRYLVYLAIGFFLYHLLRKQLSRPADAPPPDLPATEDMVRCAQCGIHLPRSEGVLAGQVTFCCVEHRDAYRR